MTKRPPGKGRGADIFLGEGDTPPVKKRRLPKGKGADVFLGTEPGTAKTRTPPPAPARPGQVSPPPTPAGLVKELDRLCRTLAPAQGRIERSHLVVMLWLRVALQEARA
jgi:hypothetical protein